MRKRTPPWLSTVAGALLVAGCADSGQTGSPSCETPYECVCPPFYQAGVVLLRGTVTAVVGDRLTMRVDENFSQPDGGAPIGPGASIDTTFRAFPCDPALSVTEGMPVLATFVPRSESPLSGDAFVVGFGDRVDFGVIGDDSHIVVNAADVPGLLGYDCEMLDVPGYECGDQIDPDDGSCTVGSTGRDEGVGSSPVLAVVAALVAGVRRKQRST